MKIVAAAVAASLLAGCAGSKSPKINCNYKVSPVAPAAAATADAEGFVSIFNGKDLTGWMGAVKTYGVDPKEPGVLQCFPNRAGEGGGGNLCTEKTYRNFVLRFEYCLPTNGNNGLGIRMPDAKSGASLNAMCELQLLDDGGSEYYDSGRGIDLLHAYQYTGSVYGIVPSRRDNVGVQTKSKEKTFTGGGSYSKKPGMWNYQEVRVVGSEIEVFLNGVLIMKTDVSKFKGDGTDTPDGKAHPGLHRTEGHIGWLGHGHNVKWRNIRVRELPDDAKMSDLRADGIKECPEGFTVLFDGKPCQLKANWKGVTTRDKLDNPYVRDELEKKNPAKAADRQKFADEYMVKHWTVRDGALFFDGLRGGYSLATKKDYKDFEMLVDWRILSPRGDSGLYLRGCPQVQIWDAHNMWNIGSGGLYNNKKNPSNALLIADNLVGSWNTFRIRMVGEKVSVWLNGKLVVDNTVLENYWRRAESVPASEQIELQCHGDPVEFRNIFIKEL